MSKETPGSPRTVRRSRPKRIAAYYPVPDDSTGTSLAGDLMRDAAAVLEAYEQDDLVASIMVFSNADHEKIASHLARLCLRLAHVVYGHKVGPWIESIRATGNAVDALADSDDAGE